MDLDVVRLTRGEWNQVTDRFRVWFIPKIEGRDDKPLLHFTLRKYDRENDVLLFMHLVPLLETSLKRDSEQTHFQLGVLCNDEVRARNALGAAFDIPPAFHRRSEVKLIEKRWRSDPRAVMFFAANVHSATSAADGGKMMTIRLEGRPSLEVLYSMKEGMGGWWDERSRQED